MKLFQYSENARRFLPWYVLEEGGVPELISKALPISVAIFGC